MTTLKKKEEYDYIFKLLEHDEDSELAKVLNANANQDMPDDGITQNSVLKLGKRSRSRLSYQVSRDPFFSGRRTLSSFTIFNDIGGLHVGIKFLTYVAEYQVGIFDY